MSTSCVTKIAEWPVTFDGDFPRSEWNLAELTINKWTIFLCLSKLLQFAFKYDLFSYVIIPGTTFNLENTFLKCLKQCKQSNLLLLLNNYK